MVAAIIDTGILYPYTVIALFEEFIPEFFCRLARVRRGIMLTSKSTLMCMITRYPFHKLIEVVAHLQKGIVVFQAIILQLVLFDLLIVSQQEILLCLPVRGSFPCTERSTLRQLGTLYHFRHDAQICCPL